MTDAEARDALRAGAEALAVELGTGQLDQLLAYVRLIERWGAVYNLTAVRDRPGIVRQHLLDSLAALPPLQRHAATLDEPLRILDVGSGAGLPGLVIVIAQPEWAVTCVDTVGKKASFMRQVIGELGLARADARHARVEDLPAGGWNLVISRAFASLQDFTRLSERALAGQGVWAAMKARGVEDEAAALTTATVFHVEPLQVPGLDAARSLVWMRRRDGAHGVTADAS